MGKIKNAQFYHLTVLTSLSLVFGVLGSNAQTTTGKASDRAVIAKLKTAKNRTLPYGFKMIASAFAHKMDAASLSKKLDDLNADLFADYDDPRRIKVDISQPLHRFWLRSGVHAFKNIKDYPGTIVFRTLCLTKRTRFELYSLMAYQQLDCNNCEYGLYQAVNVLVTISNGCMVDHMTAAFNFGNDLGYDHRYVYVDGLMRIHTVDLVSDEEGAEVRDVQSWSIDGSGHFIEKDR